MSNEIKITNHAIPATARSKNHQSPTSAGSVYTSSGSGGGVGGAPQLIKLGSSLTPSDDNTLSSLRALFEIRSRIVASDNTETELSEENTLSSLHTIAEIDAAIKLALIDIEKLYLSKTKADTATEAITFLKGLLIGDNIAHIDANGDAEVRNIVARIKAKVATLEVTGSATVGSLAAKESVTSKTVTASEQATTLNLLVQALAETYDLNVSHVATMMRTIIKDYVSSEAFTPGLTGEGFKISKALNGDWNLEIDNVVVRKVMTIFEMVISKVRSVNGGLVISPANGRIKSVAETTGSPTYYVIGIEGDMQFVVDDYVRCQVFSNGHAKYYCVRVSSISNNSILVLKSEFTNGAVPVIGDDLVQMGNATNTARQGIIYLTASEDGKPRISVMDGVNSTSLVGKNKVILGCLDGITDTDFPADFQPSGYGLYAMNVFLKGIFVLRNGKSVEGEITAAQNAAATAQAKADMVTRLFQEFTVAGGVFESKITEVKEYADGKVDGVIFGSRNLLIDSGVEFGAANYNLGNKMYSPFERKKGKQYTITMCYTLGDNNSNITAYEVSGSYGAASFSTRGSRVIESKTFTPVHPDWGVGSQSMGFYQFPNDQFGSKIHWVTIVEGNKGLNAFTPAPEDVTADAQAKADAAQAAAEKVAVAKAELAKTEASAYADGIVTSEEQRAIADAQAKLAEAKLDAQNKADAAKQAAISDAASKYPTKSEVTSSINQKADEINLSVTEKINGVQVGGRNYYKKNTAYSTLGSVAVFSRNQSINGFQLTGTLDPNNSRIRLLQVINSNGYWTVSFEFAGTQKNPVGFTMELADRAPKRFNNPSTTDEWMRVEYTVDVTNYSDDVYHFIDFEHITYTYINFRNFKVEKGNKATDWTPAPEDVQSQITENKASIQVLSDQIALKVSNDTFNALGQRVSAAESTLSVQATQIASKVSQSDFNSLGQRVGSAESAILQQADQISLKASKSDLNTLSGRVTSTEAELRVHATEIGMKVTAGDVSAGMTITANKITLFGKEFDLTGKITFSSMASDAQGKINDAQNAANAAGATAGAAKNTADKAITDAANSLVTSRNNIAAQLGYGNYDAMSAAAIAGKTIINGGKIRTELIDATAIVTGALVASVISATNITTGKLTVADNAKIGEFLVQNNSLVNYDFRASLQIGDSNSLRYVKIGGDSLNLAKIQVAGDDAVGLNITTYRPTIGRFRENFAIKSVGSHRFKQRDADDIWDAPGVLWAGRVNAWGTLENEWGNACAVSTRRTSDGKYTITHGLGHNQYYVIIQCTPYATDGWRYMIGMVEGKYSTSFDVSIVDTGQGFKNCAFDVFIVGRNKF